MVGYYDNVTGDFSQYSPKTLAFYLPLKEEEC